MHIYRKGTSRSTNCAPQSAYSSLPPKKTVIGHGWRCVGLSARRGRAANKHLQFELLNKRAAMLAAVRNQASMM
jgi:hypothetical protein